MITRKEAGQRIRAAREARKLTNKQACEILKVSPPVLSYIESGERVPSWTRLIEIAERLGLDPMILFPELFPKIEEKSEANA